MRTFVHIAVNVRKEPKLTDAAKRINVRCSSVARLALCYAGINFSDVLSVSNRRCIGASRRVFLDSLFGPVALCVPGVHAFVRRVAVVGLQVLGHVVEPVL